MPSNGKTIDQLPSKDRLLDTDYLVVDDGTVSYKIPVSLFKTFMTGVKSLSTSNGVITLTLSDNSTLTCTPSDPKKQDKLTFDSTPTANSTNPVTSGGVQSALAGKADTSALNDKVSSTEFSNSLTAVYSLIGDTFDTSKSYAVGDYVIRDNKLYKCKTACSGSWVAGNWDEQSVSDLLKAIDKRITDERSHADAGDKSLTDKLNAETLARQKATAVRQTIDTDGYLYNEYYDVK